ncbi:hypothetical protein B0H16DRAFT_1721741 [Mycena metata]|uniref:Uncharacterized protein n=1 Tax=Mycena metata TaxID=1033252 RepID=A0AAD7NEA8_9AGAR|nr:hypothetical protein B0H16DRAFT_1721741 [Mycena metata]
MARKVTGKAPGRESDFSAEKKTWLETFHQELVDAGFGVKGGDPGPVYDTVTTHFVLRYGLEEPFGRDVGDPPPDVPAPPVNVSEAEKADHLAARKKLRTAWILFFKIANWYRARYRNKKIHSGAIKSILADMRAMSGANARPRRQLPAVLYSKLHYPTRIKPRFDTMWDSLKATTPDKERIALSCKFVYTCWDEETEEFRRDIEKQAEEQHRAALEEWRAGREAPEASAEVYHEALENLNTVGIPLVDALAERLGMHVVLLAVGPVGSEGGQVALRSVFSDTAGGLTSKTWAQLDHTGFTAMEKSITRYGCGFFSKADCVARMAADR